MLTFGVAARLRIRTGVHSSDLPLQRVKGLIAEWHREKLARPDAKSRAFHAKESNYARADEIVWEFELAQLAEEGDGKWLTEIRAYAPLASASEIHLTVVMRLDATVGRIAPVRYFANPPSFLRAMEDQFEFSIGESVATRAIVPIGASEVDVLLQFLGSPDRALPAIVVTDPAHSAPTIENLARRLGEGLAGLAAVLHVSQSATLALSDTVGKEMSCFDGGVRIYWPGWRPSDPPFRHPLFLRRRIEISAQYDPQRPESLIRSTLLSLLVRAAASRFAYPMRMQEVIDADRLRRLESELENTSSGQLIEKIRDLDRQLVVQRERAEFAELEVSEAQTQIDEIRKQLEAAEDKLALVGQATGDPWEIVDYDEALDRARIDFSSTLEIPENLRMDRTLQASIWYHVLKSLSELCDLERKGEAKDKRNQLREMIRRNSGITGASYKNGNTGLEVVDATTLKKVPVRERVHVQDGKPADTASVYWHTTGATQAEYRYQIVKIGSHAE